MTIQPHDLRPKPDETGANPAKSDTARAGETLPALPDDALIIVPTRNMVLFPGLVLPVTIGRERSIAAAQEAVRSGHPIGLLLQRAPDVDDPAPTDFHHIGTVASVVRYLTAPDGAHHMICQGQHRFRVLEFLDGWPFLVARVEPISDAEVLSKEVEARLDLLRQRALEALQLLPNVPQELSGAIQGIRSATALADLVAGFLDITPVEKQGVLETFDVQSRLDKVLALLAHRIEVLQLSRKIGEQTQQSLDNRQREYLLREQLKTIQKELGESDSQSEEIAGLAKAIENAHMPPEVEAQARKELGRLERMGESSGESGMVRAYLDWLVALPWSVTSAEPIDIARARAILDEDHFGLEKIKRRILEFLAVRKLNPTGRSPILCFVGPPGVGKTSLGQSIARATGRKFVRASLGGVHDEAEIRGHRRTYIGALPGNVIQSIRKAGTRDCVFMLDEVDKLGAGGFHGDPSSALLEVLDPEQNGSFRDNYLGVPFDLSQVMFIATANMLDTIPGPLRDRMEVIELSGYTEREKLQIAQRYLVRRQLEANGLKPEQAEITDAALAQVIASYTRESGVRNLEREIGAVLRRAAMRIAEGGAQHVRVDANDLTEILGASRFESEVAMRTSVPGVATGLAWTPMGGDILFIEAARVSGSGRLILTGQLGDVMKESAQAALSLVKSKARALGLEVAALDKSDIHVHVPAGAVPKDGPSAGVAMFVALASLLTGRKVRSDTAMTGEISLRGLVLPVGGIKEKVVAAVRAGLKTVLLPARNRKDFEEIPADARERIAFVWLEQVDDALAAVLTDRDDADPTRVSPPHPAAAARQA
ncbi:MAG TPA: endopeptidase La [Candidatus Sulfotelmatobacter sp.]|nr:endopeptidase La [Candidatus Sulfotelmatobacter sp.]